MSDQEKLTTIADELTEVAKKYNLISSVFGIILPSGALMVRVHGRPNNTVILANLALDQEKKELKNYEN